MWEKEIAVAHQAALTSGKLISELFGKIRQITKKGEIDLVTEADTQSEKIILDIIGDHFPQDSIITEESGGHNHLPERVWLVDPLDGTTNFAHAFPFFGVSIALEVERELVLGVVFNPLMDEYFEAAKGQGAFLNKKAIRVSQSRTLQDSLLVTGFPYDIRENHERILEHFRRMVLRAQGVRRLGSAALDLCYVGAGRLDGYWEEGLKPWDSAAGTVIAKEAGGTVSTYDGRSFLPYEETIVASNPFIHELMLEALNA
jgi:myo-inositol-1(or 4)-monophosphatase